MGNKPESDKAETQGQPQQDQHAIARHVENQLLVVVPSLGIMLIH